MYREVTGVLCQEPKKDLNILGIPKPEVKEDIKAENVLEGELYCRREIYMSWYKSLKLPIKYTVEPIRYLGSINQFVVRSTKILPKKNLR